MVQPVSDDITLGDIGRILWSRRWLVAGGTLIGTSLAVVIALVTPPTYRAEALLAPVPSENRDWGLSQQLGGIASLAGIATASGIDRQTEAFAVLQSRSLTEAFITDNGLLPVLFAERWDRARGAWKDADPQLQPTLWDGNDLFARKIRQVTTDAESGLIVLAIEWHDPQQAAAWVGELVRRTNERLRSEAIARSERNVAYLKKQLDQTSIIEVRQAIYRLIESEIKSAMLAQGNDEYAYKIIDPAVVPQEKVRPQRKLIVALGLCGGFALTCVFVLFLGAGRTRSAA
jgi:uncharacterized protein involved in exopolysaccharide biosynthesis